MEGFIVLYRKLLDWQWGDDPLTGWLWMRLLLTANYKDKKWHGIVIKRGQLVTTLSELSEQTGLSFKQIRSRLNKLIESGCVGKQTTNKYTILTICKYDDYQFAPDDIPEQRANKGQTKGKQMGKQRANKQDTPTHYDTDSYPRTENEEGKQMANKGQANGQTLYIYNKETSKEINVVVDDNTRTREVSEVFIDSKINSWKNADIVSQDNIPELNPKWIEDIKLLVRRFNEKEITAEEVYGYYEDFKAQENNETLQDTYANWRRHFNNFIRKRIKRQEDERDDKANRDYNSPEARAKRLEGAAKVMRKLYEDGKQYYKEVSDH